MISPLEDSFTIFVSSTKSVDVFENNSTNFRNLLGRNLDVSEYNVALRCIVFYDNYKTPPLWERLILEAKEAPLEPFFKKMGEDNRITFTKIIMEIVNLTNTFANLAAFTTYANEVFRQYDIDAYVVLSVTSETKTVEGREVPVITYRLAKLVNFDTNGFSLVLPRTLARVWGFTKTEFSVGTHYSDLNISDVYFERVRQNAVIAVEKRKAVKTSLLLPQKIDATLEDIVLEMQTVIKDAGGELLATVKDEELTLEYTLEPVASSLSLPPFLSKYLGLGDAGVLTGHQIIPVTAQMIKPYGEVYKRRHEYLLEYNLSQIAVECNCVNETLLFNSKFLPCIALIDREEGIQKRIFRPKKLVFYPATKSILNHVSIKLVADTGVVIPPYERPTTVELFFQKALDGASYKLH